MKLRRQNRLPFSSHIQASTMKLHTRCYLLLALGVPLCKREWGVPLNVGTLVPITTFGEKAQRTKVGTSKFGTPQNQTNWNGAIGPIEPQINPVLYQKMCFFFSKDQSHRN